VLQAAQVRTGASNDRDQNRRYNAQKSRGISVTDPVLIMKYLQGSEAASPTFVFEVPDSGRIGGEGAQRAPASNSSAPTVAERLLAKRRGQTPGLSSSPPPPPPPAQASEQQPQPNSPPPGLSKFQVRCQDASAPSSPRHSHLATCGEPDGEARGVRVRVEIMASITIQNPLRFPTFLNFPGPMISTRTRRRWPGGESRGELWVTLLLPVLLLARAWAVLMKRPHTRSRSRPREVSRPPTKPRRKPRRWPRASRPVRPDWQPRLAGC
jgi:hypothetical protein